MKRIFILTILLCVLLSQVVFAAEWKLVDSNNFADTYVDVDSIKVESDESLAYNCKIFLTTDGYIDFMKHVSLYAQEKFHETSIIWRKEGTNLINGQVYHKVYSVAILDHNDQVLNYKNYKNPKWEKLVNSSSIDKITKFVMSYAANNTSQVIDNSDINAIYYSEK
ncbi:hypothetical protein [Pectinatus frisingensis]|uniref:hypothetical protein n=1 Tax=Pectinatus frisingensis TaxID=865 RepID=UPI0018C4EF24|nr:hypothetical protein [Pectinatus frisingensis]